MELEEPLLQGYMLLPPQGMLQQLKKSWHKKYCQIFKASKFGIQRLEIYDNQEEALSQQHTQRIITLEACIKISLSSQPLTFTLVTKSGIHHFGCSSEIDMSSWVSAFQSVAFKDEASSITVEEDNDLYCTSGEGVFTVRISETEASRKCGLESLKNYTLIISPTEMKLMDGSHMLYTWPYQYIRKYGYSEKKFTFEAGRRCGSGEGSFCLEHKNQLDIYRCFVSNKKKMKQMLSGDNSPTVECNDAQFHAALSMEAGSRSPLPPSVNTSKNLIDLDIAGCFAQSKPQHLPSPISPTEPVKPPLPAKPKPVKPPRKPVFTTSASSSPTPSVTSAGSKPEPPPASKKPTDLLDLSIGSIGSIGSISKYRKQLPGSPATSPDLPQKNILVQDHKSQDSGHNDADDGKHPYDLVEVRSDAWRTHGLDSVPHTERLKAAAKSPTDKDPGQDQDHHPHYETMSFPSNPQNSIKSNSPSIIHNVPSPNDPPDYDRLQHFGSIHKSKKKPGYRAPNLSSQLSSADSNSSGAGNNYDIVEDLSSIRMADDSHHGYGIIRKKSSSSLLANEPKHKIVNDSEYAIVSKPKRV